MMLASIWPSRDRIRQNQSLLSVCRGAADNQAKLKSQISNLKTQILNLKTQISTLNPYSS